MAEAERFHAYTASLEDEYEYEYDEHETEVRLCCSCICDPSLRIEVSKFRLAHSVGRYFM